ncbi:hypothetical protein A2926_01255 [Candidatus Giovannonibacteria bacterium RIFCSPLOWO2_01_FULL_44_40]|uniref:Protease PrsW n=1 Tax=Candidatus Giovannonibacteria bacterium RIFCSPHIGHO2_01_FULL_45_23 TaxID=1798325 RepID=A0A1F5VI21_9BACT|nr:MAG: hypothetical protein A2834_02325 [Candidatus Giovannonibacteria bacterium RIFCSPHIGHO2_01_FULL_45_23]OGF75280.1 MAG: hypothetical protein A3C77_02375 [Candidatus Giovannonibacteria bacterium RIFCSPHIGHO2_02_FULL_45_13]OGF80040.1 MAG: hypothetical protein A2926_01255 [Candidatus Giovannonibacteria bacterium RIFCSPLOWO2_01_FULL_44_40]
MAELTFPAHILLTMALAFLPALLWLWFWLKEDAHPEPRREILIVFLAGMGGVILAIILENNFFAANRYFQKLFGYSISYFQIFNIVGFAFFEEIVKTAAAFFTALKSRYFDEPVDAMIYLVAAALGFAALENALFIGEGLKSGLAQSVAISAFRFTNAVLLHVSAAAIIGAGFAFSFFHKERLARELVLSLFLATLLHSFYNFFIIENVGGEAANQILVTALVVFGATLALVLFERAKRATI